MNIGKLFIGLILCLTTALGKSFAQDIATASGPTLAHASLSAPVGLNVSESANRQERPVMREIDWRLVFDRLMSERLLHNGSATLPIPLDEAIRATLIHSARLQGLRLAPQIESQRVMEEAGTFDWTFFTEAQQTDSQNSTGLVADSNQLRIPSGRFQGQSGIRKQTLFGSELQVSGAVNGAPQGDINESGGLMAIRLSQELLQGRGKTVVGSRIVTARLQAASSHEETLAQVADTIEETSQTYWELYAQRATLVIHQELLKRTEDLATMLTARRDLDADDSVLLQTESAMYQRRQNILESKLQLKLAQAQLYRVINAPVLGHPGIEVLPQSILQEPLASPDSTHEIQLALMHRPEIRGALRRQDISRLDHQVAINRLLPKLTVSSEGQFSGSDGALATRASTEPFADYLLSIKLEYPLANHSARGQVRRTELEQIQKLREIEDISHQVILDVREAILNLQGYAEQLAMIAQIVESAQAELRYREARRANAPNENSVPSLELDQLLRAQERYGQACIDWVKTLSKYNAAQVTLRRANGTLVMEFATEVPQPCYSAAELP